MTRSTCLAVVGVVERRSSCAATIVRVGRLDRDAGLLERVARPSCRSVGGVRDPPRVALVDDVLGAGVERGQHQVVLVDRPSAR